MSQSPYKPEHRAAAYFFKLMGSPAEFDKPETFKLWMLAMRELMGTYNLDIDEMKRILKWAVEVNSRKYLMVSHDPMATLKKNFINTVKHWRVENPVIDPDPLYEDYSDFRPDGKTLVIKKRVRRKPQTVAERKELLALPRRRGYLNPNLEPWLIQDKCPTCRGTGHIIVNNKKYTRFRHFVLCECVFTEELL